MEDEKCNFQYRVPGNHGKEHYHLALVNLHQKYGPLVREVICGFYILHLLRNWFLQVIGSKVIVHVFSPEDIQTVYK